MTAPTLTSRWIGTRQTCPLTCPQNHSRVLLIWRAGRNAAGCTGRVCRDATRLISRLLSSRLGNSSLLEHGAGELLEIRVCECLLKTA